MLCQERDIVHLSVGDHLREIGQHTANENDDEEHRTICQHLRQGTLLPVDTILSILTHKLDHEQTQGHDNILLDGFPRRLTQGVEFERQVDDIHLVIHVQCPKEVARERYLSRHLPGRLEDDGAMFEQRYAEFERENAAIVAHYRAVDKLIEVPKIRFPINKKR
ncbi:MAG: hypothetical protein M1826_007227, partial [Phylliscum demangeonii]